MRPPGTSFWRRLIDVGHNVLLPDKAMALVSGTETIVKTVVARIEEAEAEGVVAADLVVLPTALC